MKTHFGLRTALSATFACLLGPSALLAALRFEAEELTQKAALGTQKIDYVFKFQNTGTAMVYITQVHSGCGCTVPNWPREPIAPGATGVLPVSYDPEGKQGRQTQRIHVDTSDQQSRELRIVAELPVRVTLAPRLLLFKGTAPDAKSAVVTFSDDTPVTLLEVISENPRFELSESPALSGDTVKITVRYTGDSTSTGRGVIRVRSRTHSGQEHSDLIYTRYTP
ncbi:MAG: DUF1573 domain-containing protein [Verrucomicrobia bacterium]|nr:MAG: DUF1573 domain-containing protein [Verrucomicrobiota bacterium]